MMDAEHSVGILVPQRTIRPPQTVSAQAQAFLSQPMYMSATQLPDLNDKEGWRSYIGEGNAAMAEMLATQTDGLSEGLATHRLNAFDLYEITPASMTKDGASSAILFLHGGGYIFGAGMIAAYMAMPLANAAGLKTFSVDYRMPPDHPFPAAVDDTIEAYRWLLEHFAAKNIVVAGQSAGGGLAAAFVLKARDIGLPLPAACVLATPEVDLTESGDSFETNDTVDVVLPHRLTEVNALYADGHDLRNPYLSPLFADFSKGFPPTFLQSGTRDLFLSNTVRMHRALCRAGMEAELHVWEAMPHGGFFGAPEDQEVLTEQARFIRKRLIG